ncbi:MAG: hypothetical protein KatS3mg014_0548 [Actinomycetota bacterium]|nr:MAG: hypothetical protein KatS3mg014_0548 [Actinomycetota bacterium]
MSFGVRELTVRFGAQVALDAVSLDVPPGRVTAVVGGDGAGRTTLLRTLAGVLSPSSGEVRRPDPRRIGYLPATGGVYLDLTVAENLAFRARAYRDPSGWRERAETLLARTGLAEARGRLVGHLSGGMRRKLGVVCAMLHRPDLLVLDEPTTGVDPVSRADLWWLIARAAAAGAAVVLSTSYLDEAERAAWVLALHAGRALAQGAPEEIRAAVPGLVCRASARPADPLGRRAWRRGASWRVWLPDAAEPPVGLDPVHPDLADAVTVAALARQLETEVGPS